MEFIKSIDHGCTEIYSYSFLYKNPDTYNFFINAINTMSMVAKMTFKDGTTLMITGDATGNGMEICAKMYSLYLESDIVQVCHHGTAPGAMTAV